MWFGKRHKRQRKDFGARAGLAERSKGERVGMENGRWSRLQCGNNRTYRAVVAE
jgi:hypothetical protein